MRYFFLFIVSALTFSILWFNVKLYPGKDSKTERKEDILLQLNFLEADLKRSNLGIRMQEFFPEGYVFIYALYGLAWCELSLADETNTALQSRALDEALFAYNNLNSDMATWNYDSDLNPSYGIFYSGWKNYVLSKILLVDTTFNDHQYYVEAYKVQCALIADALKKSETPFLESYSTQSWPADMSVAMASLSNHDRIFEPQYELVITDWINGVKLKLDPVTGMIPHKVNAESGEAIEGARGSSMGLTLRMMGEIDKSFGQEQFDLFATKFVSQTFGLPSIREYPIGQDGLGDIDSGPVIFGVGFSATLASIGTLAMYRKESLSIQQYKTIHAFGFDSEDEDQKIYLFGELPMADAFIAWGRATALGYSSSPSEEIGNYWTLKFHLISLTIVSILWILFFRKRLLLYIRNATNKGSF